MNTGTKGKVGGWKPALPENHTHPWQEGQQPAFLLFLSENKQADVQAEGEKSSSRTFYTFLDKVGESQEDPSSWRAPVSNMQIGKETALNSPCIWLLHHHWPLVRRNHAPWWSRSPRTSVKDLRKLSSSERCLWVSRGVSRARGILLFCCL